jgi:hypothetical protein
MYRVSAMHVAESDPLKVAATVTADGKCMIRDGFTIHDVDHNFIFLAPPHPYEWIEQRKIIKESQSTPFLTRKSVTSCGDPLAVCSVGAVGANLNCHDSGMVLSGAVFCTCTVVTKAQLAAIIERILDDIEKIIVRLLPTIIELLGRKYKRLAAVPRAVVEWIAKKVVPAVFWVAKQVGKAIAERVEQIL